MYSYQYRILAGPFFEVSKIQYKYVYVTRVCVSASTIGAPILNQISTLTLGESPYYIDTSHGKSQTTLSIDVEDAPAVAFVLLRKRELKIPTKNIERSK